MLVPRSRVRRRRNRSRVFSVAYIVHGCSLAKQRRLCFVHDINQDGAQIEQAEDFVPPPRFVLELRDEATPHNARLVWREGRRLGVSFRETGDLAELSAPEQLAEGPALA